jgi:hypothetical protein
LQTTRTDPRRRFSVPLVPTPRTHPTLLQPQSVIWRLNAAYPLNGDQSNRDHGGAGEREWTERAHRPLSLSCPKLAFSCLLASSFSFNSPLEAALCAPQRACSFPF